MTRKRHSKRRKEERSKIRRICHSRASRNPWLWTPAFAGVTLLAGLILASVTFAATTKDQAWEKYVTSYKKLQVAFHDLVRLNKPELGKAIDNSLELGLLMMDEKTDRFYYLLEAAPERIIRNAGFRAFINFAWLDEDNEKLLAKSRSYRKLEDRLKSLKEKTEKNSNFPKIQEELTRMESDQRYMEVVSRFRFVSEEVEKLLGEK